MKNRSIKYKLIRLFLIMGITPSLLIMSIMYFGVSDNLEKQTGHNLQILATETSLRVGLFLQNKIQNVLKYSAYSTLKRLFFPGSNESMASEFIRSLFKFDEDLNNICLIDNNRNLLFSYRPNFGTLNKIDLWWEQALRLHHREILFFSSPPSPSSSEKMKLEIITPIMSDLNDKQLGFMATNIDLSSLVKMIQTIPISGEYYISLIDQNGNLISCTYEKKHRFIPEVLLKFLFENSKGWLQGFDPLMKAYAVFGFDEVSEYKGHALRGQIWKVYVSRKKEEAFEPIFWLLVKLLAIGMGVILLILIIFMFRIEAIWKPIFALKKGAEMIGAGNLDMVLFIQTGDELEDLAQTFNSMGKNLKTSRKILEEQNRKLIELNDVKNNFLSMVSHELRTPLMIIKEALSQILEGYKGEVREEQKEYLNMAHRNTSRLQKIIEDLLSISKIETGKIKFNRYKTDLISIMRNEINNQKIKSDEKKITITENFDRDTLDIYCDGEKMQIIFTNLLGNAIKFTPIEGHIRVSMQVNDQEIRIQMDDDGPGIPPQLCDKIFERFFRISSTPLIGSPSTGLGLAIAKELVGMHHGKIWAESDGIKGSSFFFTLPRYKGKDYLKVYFNDRIHEALDRELNLSVLRIAVEFIGESIKNRVKSEFSKRIFLDLKELIINNLFELIETVMLEEQAEIYAFSFVDGDSAKILSKKTQHLLEEYVEKNKLQNQIKIRVISATLGENGNSCDELLEWIYQAKVPTSDRDSAS